MPSLVITKNTTPGNPLYGDWSKPPKRQAGQADAGYFMRQAFIAETDVGAIVEATLRACWKDEKYSIWMRYDGDVDDSFAIVENLDEGGKSVDEDERGQKTFNLKLDYSPLKPIPDGDPIVRLPSKKLTLKVNEDSKPGNTANKTMNVTVPSDFEDFKTDYLGNMLQDIEDITDPVKDKDYLLSSLTFRRCL